MARLVDSTVELNPEQYRRIETPGASDNIPTAPAQPYFLSQSSVMICSLPSVATGADGVIRQFNNAASHLPTRRILVP